MQVHTVAAHNLQGVHGLLHPFCLCCCAGPVRDAVCIILYVDTLLALCLKISGAVALVQLLEGFLLFHLSLLQV